MPLRDRLKKYVASTLVQNVAVMFSGNSVALILPFILAPLITRIYTPEDFAGYEIFARLLTLMIVLAGMRYEHAIIIPKEDGEALAILRLCNRILIALTVVSAIIFWPFREWWAAVFNNDDLADLLWWLPPGVYFGGLLTHVSYYLLRASKYRFMAGNKVIAVGSNHGLKYLIGLKISTSMSLVAAHVLGMVIPALLFFTLPTFREALRKMRKNTYSLSALARKYSEYPTVNAGHSLYNEGYQTLLFLVISVYYGELIFGLFAFTYRYLRIPVQVFGSSMSKVLMPDLAQEYNVGKPLKTKIKRAAGVSAAVALVPFGLLLFFGEEVFGIFFGKEWAGAGRYAEIMVPWLFFNFIVSPISMLPTILRKQGRWFVYSFAGNTLAVLAAFLMALQDCGFEQVLLAVTAIGAVHSVALLVWLIRIAPGTPAEIGSFDR